MKEKDKKIRVASGFFWGACIGVYAYQIVKALPYNNKLKPIAEAAWISMGTLMSASIGGLTGACCVFFEKKSDDNPADDLERAIQSFRSRANKTI